VIDTLKKWLPVYLPEVERQLGRPLQMPQPKTYTTRRKFAKFPEDQLPTIIVVSPGLDDDPNEEGDGSYRATWRIHIGCVVSTSDMAATNLAAKIMGAATRSVILQHASLGGIACGVEWYDESYDDLPDDDASRSLGASSVSFRVEVEDVVNWKRGPDGVYLPDPDPDAQPGDEWPVADTVTVELIKEAL
jgi:hypothetical protein